MRAFSAAGSEIRPYPSEPFQIVKTAQECLTSLQNQDLPHRFLEGARSLGAALGDGSFVRSGRGMGQLFWSIVLVSNGTTAARDCSPPGRGRLSKHCDPANALARRIAMLPDDPSLAAFNKSNQMAHLFHLPKTFIHLFHRLLCIEVRSIQNAVRFLK